MKKLLYIEDTENNRILITRRLGQSGYQVLTAENAAQGIEVARAEKPDLILMDMGLPDVDGWSATRRFKSDARLEHIPIIALTAHVMHGDREKAIAAGCDDYDTKPFHFARLLSKIEGLLVAYEGRSPGTEQIESEPAAVKPPLADLIAQAQHDLRNPLGNILGFCEILLGQIPPGSEEALRLGLQSIENSANLMVTEINRGLDPDRSPPGANEISSLQAQLRQQASHILLTIQTLLSKRADLEDDLWAVDLRKMSDSARRVSDLIEKGLSFYPVLVNP